MRPINDMRNVMPVLSTIGVGLAQIIAIEFENSFKPANRVAADQPAWCEENSFCETLACCREYSADQAGHAQAN